MNRFSSQTYAATRRPLEQASALPGWCYHDAEWHEREMDAIFRKDWLCIGRTEQIPRPGDYYTMDLVGQPLIVVHDTEGVVRVHSAVCRHRAAVVAQGEGHCRAFVCPYHSWSYGLDGRLLAVPGPMRASVGFAKEANGLHPVRCELWGGFIFANLDPDAPPLLQALGQAATFLANYDLAAMRRTHFDVLEVGCNWKVWLENAFENYHTATVHHKHVDPARPSQWVFETMTDGSFEAFYSERSLVSYGGLPAIEGLAPRQAGGMFHLWLKPSLQLVLTPTYVKYRQYLPEVPDRLRLIENWMFPATTIARPEFAEIVTAGYYDRYAEILREDAALVPAVQHGLRSGAYRPGRYSTEEYIVHRIANWVLDRTLAGEPTATAATTATMATTAS